MIKQILFSLLLALFPLCTVAQSATDMQALSERADQVKAMKIGYMADQMKLTAHQSVAFWPLYNEYWKARYDLFNRKRKAQDRIRSNEAAQSDIDELIAVEAEQTIIMKRFTVRFEQIISIDQTAKMFVAEETFKSVLLKTLK